MVLFKKRINFSGVTYTCYDGIKRDALEYYFFNDSIEHEYFDSHFSHDDWFNSHDDEEVCLADFTNAPDSVTLRSIETFTTTCVDGPCLDIAKKHGHHNGHHHFHSYHG